MQKITTNKGCYLLIIEVKRETRVKVGSLGYLDFKRGYYIYVGSAMNNLEKRVKRHFRKDKKIRWHIDYLTLKAKINKAILIPSDKKIECKIAKELSKIFKFVPRFGCSDCKCKSHLFYSSSYPNLDKIIKNVGLKMSEISD